MNSGETSSFSFTVFTTRPRSSSININIRCKLNLCLISDNPCKINKTLDPNDGYYYSSSGLGCPRSCPEIDFDCQLRPINSHTTNLS